MSLLWINVPLKRLCMSNVVYISHFLIIGLYNLHLASFNRESVANLCDYVNLLYSSLFFGKSPPEFKLPDNRIRHRLMIIYVWMCSRCCCCWTANIIWLSNNMGEDVQRTNEWTWKKNNANFREKKLTSDTNRGQII